MHALAPKIHAAGVPTRQGQGGLRCGTPQVQDRNEKDGDYMGLARAAGYLCFATRRLRLLRTSLEQGGDEGADR